jgi:hypothetical protein
MIRSGLSLPARMKISDTLRQTGRWLYLEIALTDLEKEFQRACRSPATWLRILLRLG